MILTIIFFLEISAMNNAIIDTYMFQITMLIVWIPMMYGVCMKLYSCYDIYDLT